MDYVASDFLDLLRGMDVDVSWHEVVIRQLFEKKHGYDGYTIAFVNSVLKKYPEYFESEGGLFWKLTPLGSSFANRRVSSYRRDESQQRRSYTSQIDIGEYPGSGISAQTLKEFEDFLAFSDSESESDERKSRKKKNNTTRGFAHSGPIHTSSLSDSAKGTEQEETVEKVQNFLNVFKQIPNQGTHHEQKSKNEEEMSQPVKKFMAFFQQSDHQ
uniref:Fork-head domain-containing protein n=1 Tax=Caenorhabditis tropicalis TaxID=1561998 RepID=A0A1I7TLR6_9PELO